MSNENSITSINQFLNIPTVDDYTDLENDISEGVRQQIAKIVLSASAGLVTMVPLICKGPTQCPFIDRCPIYMADGSGGNYPIQKQCILEVNLAHQNFSDYARELLEVHSRDVRKSISLRSQVSKLVEFDIYEYRINLILAGVGSNTESDGTMLLKQTINITEDGDEIEQLQEHPIWKIKERIQRQRMELLDAMGLTEKRKAMIDASLGKSDQEGYFGKTIELLEKFAAITRG